MLFGNFKSRDFHIVKCFFFSRFCCTCNTIFALNCACFCKIQFCAKVFKKRKQICFHWKPQLSPLSYELLYRVCKTSGAQQQGKLHCYRQEPYAYPQIDINQDMGRFLFNIFNKNIFVKPSSNSELRSNTLQSPHQFLTKNVSFKKYSFIRVIFSSASHYLALNVLELIVRKNI